MKSDPCDCGALSPIVFCLAMLAIAFFALWIGIIAGYSAHKQGWPMPRGYCHVMADPACK